MVVGGEGLVPEEDDLVVVEGLADLGDGGVGERGGEVDAGELGADGGTEGAGVEVLPREAGEAFALGGEVGGRTHERAAADLTAGGAEAGAGVLLGDDVGVRGGHGSPSGPDGVCVLGR